MGADVLYQRLDDAYTTDTSQAKWLESSCVIGLEELCVVDPHGVALPDDRYGVPVVGVLGLHCVLVGRGDKGDAADASWELRSELWYCLADVIMGLLHHTSTRQHLVNNVTITITITIIMKEGAGERGIKEHTLTSSGRAALTWATRRLAVRKAVTKGTGRSVARAVPGARVFCRPARWAVIWVKSPWHRAWSVFERAGGCGLAILVCIVKSS